MVGWAQYMYMKLFWYQWLSDLSQATFSGPVICTDLGPPSVYWMYYVLVLCEWLLVKPLLLIFHKNKIKHQRNMWILSLVEYKDKLEISFKNWTVFVHLVKNLVNSLSDNKLCKYQTSQKVSESIHKHNGRVFVSYTVSSAIYT